MKKIFTSLAILFCALHMNGQTLDFGTGGIANQFGWVAATPTWPGSSGRIPTPSGNNPRDQLRNLEFGPNIGFMGANGGTVPANSVQMIVSIPDTFGVINSGGPASTYWSAGSAIADTVVGGVNYKRYAFTLIAAVNSGTDARTAIPRIMTTSPYDRRTSKVFLDYRGINGYTVINLSSVAGYNPGLGIQVTMQTNNPPVITPDFNTSMTNVPVTGNMNTNDYLPAGPSSYGTPVAGGSNPAGGTLTMNPDGTYTFTGTTPGTYTYTVPVTYGSGAGTTTVNEPVTITVVDPKATNNTPIVAPDVTNTTMGTAVTVKSLSNDMAGNVGGTLNPASVSVSTAPKNGTFSVNTTTGDITYTPNAGFKGRDSLQYTVCDNSTPTPLCGSAWQYITVDPAGMPNHTTASDDYATTLQNTPVSGNVKTNDKDPDGSTQNVIPQTTTIPGKGTLVLASNGTYTFTPAGNFTGPVDFPYTTCNSVAAASPGQDCSGATLHILVEPYNPQPDVNVSVPGTPATGNVSSNDQVPPGTTYGTPVAGGSNPSGGTISMNPDGTYTFTGTTPGVYTYDVPVCPPAQTSGCPTTPLTITVTDPSASNNPPVVVTDVAMVNQNNSSVGTKNSVTVKTLANDAAGNPGGSLNPASVTIVSAPAHGTTSIAANGDITYTPADGYSGSDVLTYRVCDNSTPTPLCGTAKQVFTVMPTNTTGTPTSPNTTIAGDDYITTLQNMPVSGNLKTNDTDPEGNTQTVTAQNTTIPGKGALVLASTGAYTFTPVSGFTGTLDMPYTVCDNGTPQACATGTLHVTVKPFELNPDFTVTTPGVPVSGNANTNDNVPKGTTYGAPTAGPGNPTATVPTMNPDGTYTFTSTTPGVYVFNVPVCPPGQSTGCPTSPLTITVNDPVSTTNKPILNPDVATTKGAPTTPAPVTINVLSNDAPGNTGGVLGTPTIPSQPAHGTATVDGSGNVVYTPTAGYYGTDVITYQVCEPQGSSNCNTTTVTVTVVAPDATDVLSASDDYISTIGTNTASGNVLTNDKGTGALTVTTAGTTTIPGKGTLTMAANGTYSFVPVAGFTGTVDLPYTVKDASNATAMATLHVMVKPFELNPDFTVTTPGVPVTGNVHTNDNVPDGTTYGTPTAGPGNPTATVPTMNPDGTYTFTSTTPGVYVFNVPVCPPGQSTGCPTSPLTITVNDPVSTTNKPILNPDVATTKGSATTPAPVTINVLSNDAPGNTGGVLGTPTIPGQPAHGTATVDGSGNVVYTPTAGYYGTDVITYQVCEPQGSSNCSTTTVTVTVVAPDATDVLSASDDYVSTIGTNTASGNVLTNDKGTGALTVTTAGTTTIPGKGTLTIAANGTYSFVPVAGFVGTVDLPYTVKDAANATATATLHVMVKPFELNPDFTVTTKNVPVTGNVHTNDNVPDGTTYGTPVAGGSNPSGGTISMNPNGTYTFTGTTPGVYTYDVPACPPGQSTGCPTTSLTITVNDSASGSNAPIVNTDFATTKTGTAITVNSLANDAAGNPGGTLNPASVTIVSNPLNGTASVNTSTGAVTYTPNPGFVGTDVLAYQVCDKSTPTPLCGTAKQYFTVEPANAPNSTIVVDDYITITKNTPGSGNILLNDSDPQGDAQAATPQNTTIPGKGTLVLNSNGTYTVTPANGYTGPIDFVYTVCDNNPTPVCAEGTLHVLVKSLIPDFTPTIDIDDLAFPAPAAAGSTKDFVVNISEVKNAPSNGQITVKIIKAPFLTYTFNATATSANVFGGTPVNNNDWTVTQTSSTITCVLKTGVVIPGYGLSALGFTATRKAGVAPNTNQTITATIVDGSGGDSNGTNNQYTVLVIAR